MNEAPMVEHGELCVGEVGGVGHRACVVRVRVRLPIVGEAFDVAFAEAAWQLTTEEVAELLGVEGQEPASWAVHKVVRRLKKDNADLADGYAEYLASYRRVNRRLLDCRGYAFDGDEEPTLELDTEELRGWLQLNRPSVLRRASR